MQRRALVLFSGGQDSATCLAWALDRYEYVETIGFNYGQRHAVELECRTSFTEGLRRQYPDWSAKLGDDHLLDIRVLGEISDTALTKTKAIEIEHSGLPNTFVPGRNLLFLNLAGAVAFRRGLTVLVGGMCETDYSGYPDCRDTTVKAVQVALSLGLDQQFVIDTPLMWVNKAETWRLAEHIGGSNLIDLVQEYTHTCYRGDRTKRHRWGYGCNECPACELRKNGFNEFYEKREN